MLAPEGDVPLHHRARHRLLARVGVKQQAHLHLRPEGMVRLVCVWGPLWVYVEIWGGGRQGRTRYYLLLEILYREIRR